MRKLKFFALLAAVMLISSSATAVFAADGSTTNQNSGTTVTTSDGSTTSNDGTVVTQPTTTDSGGVTSCGDDNSGTDGTSTDNGGTGTSDSTDGSGSGTDGTSTDNGGTLTLNLESNSGLGTVVAIHNGSTDGGTGHGDHGNGDDKHTNGDGSSDNTQSSDSSACPGKHKGWSEKIQNILKHLQDQQTVPGDLQSQLDALMQWAQSQNGSESDVQALQDIEAALQAQASSGGSSSQDLQLLATTQDNLNDVNGSITTLETAMQNDQSNTAIVTQLANQFAKKGDKTIKVFVKGQKPTFDVTPTILNGRTMVPLRAIGDALGANVQWDATTNTITLSNQNGTTVQLQTNSNVAEVNGQQVTLDAPATVQNGRTLVPLRALGNFFGLNVDWYQNAQMAVLD